MEGVKRFYSDELSLRPIRIESFGPFMFVLFNNDQCAPAHLPELPLCQNQAVSAPAASKLAAHEICKLGS